MTTSDGALEDLYCEYLSSRLNPQAGLSLSNSLAAAGLSQHALALEHYFQANSVPKLTTPIPSIGGRPSFAGPLPPSDPQLGQVWFDLFEVCPMILVPNKRDPALRLSYWVTLHPVYVWQFRVFLNLVRFESGRTEFPVPSDLMAKERFAACRSIDYVTGVYQDEAVAYAAWFGKSLCGRMTLSFARALGGNQLLDSVLPPGMRLWDGAEVSSSEFLRIAVGQNTLDKLPWEEEELREEDEHVPPDDQMLFEEWEKRQDTGFVTCVSSALGLDRSKTASTIHMSLLNVMDRADLTDVAGKEMASGGAGVSLGDPRAKLKSFIKDNMRARDLDLRGVNLAGVDLARLAANALDLRSADLRGAILRDAHFTGCRLENARLHDADCSGATLRMCALDNVQATGVLFEAARLEDSTAEAGDFSRANFRGAHLTETSFARAVLRDAVLDNAEGQGVEFRGADLRGASLIGVQFDQADFRGADLRRVNLAQGRFHSADFRGALLDGVTFETADCKSALFDQGEGPQLVAAAPTPAPSDILSELLASLPAAVAGAGSPGGIVDQTQSLIAKLAQSADYSPEQRQMLEKHLADLAGADHPSPELLESLMASLNADSDEPPEDLKPFLEPFLKIASGAKSTDELIEMLRAGKDNELSPELQSAIDAILHTGKK